MWLVVGLGNPDRKYAKNRHNVGFMAVDVIRSDIGAPEWREKYKGVFTKGAGYEGELVLLKPMTYMNLSGESVQPASALLKVAPKNIVVLHDEIDLPFGDVRLKVGGGHAGHNGLRSIIDRLGTADFHRVRIGVGRPPPGFRGEVADWVLSDFDAVETAELPAILERAADAVKRLVRDGPQAAMNAVNTRK
jgi:PTH1 family peptidyl-tRNA hydrolase